MAQESWKKETDQTECETPEGPILCANNCGFFGSAMTNNMCSKCYKDLVMKHKSMVSPPVTEVEKKTCLPACLEVEKKPTLPSSSVQIKLIEDSNKVDGSSEVKAVVDQTEELCKKQPANRCLQCRKRVGLTGFKCRCGGTFCSSHRYSESHECSFDYKTAGREAIAKQNPVVKAEKIEKI
ncbi:zinc finger A20 and AN1 domain-containing stress-associated protein 6-like [Canna indica]|uniref:Zinc finger A20 and AN1 domain-containing stress-associated protein 6-like n=1 Tax=Canna indica TaxID=4628 RepID=A0AAQ3KFL9_9LILI|nr:zinc finger A20 and AN1 domain-containing stress-associated protein 6-like [Canna indica]